MRPCYAAVPGPRRGSCDVLVNSVDASHETGESKRGGGCRDIRPLVSNRTQALMSMSFVSLETSSAMSVSTAMTDR